MNLERRQNEPSLLRQMPLLKSVSNDTLKKIEQQAKRLNFARGQEIVMPSDSQNDAFILLSGAARVSVFAASGKSVNFRRVDPGDLFGEFSAIDGQKRSASVEAVEPSTVLCISSDLFRELMESDSAFVHAVLNHLVALLRSTTARIVEFSTLGVTNRIHAELLRMARSAHGDDGRGYEISPAPTHSEIAGRISTHREAVSREISQLKQSGILESRGRSIIVKDFQRLEQMVSDAYGE